MDTLGIIESRSIAFGIELTDGMLKAASVDLLRASAVCSGRYVVFISGDRDSVSTAINFARNSNKKLIGSYVISHISKQVLGVLKKTSFLKPKNAIGVVESKHISSGVFAADIAAKRSEIELLKFVTGNGICGKSYFIMGGDVAAVEEATKIASDSLGKDLVGSVVIPRPDSAIIRALTIGDN